MPIIELPADPFAALRLVANAQNEMGTAFRQLLDAPSDNTVRRELHRVYREKASHYLELLHWHNESGLAPSKWDITPVAQPIVQQAMIEAAFVEA
ncbi:MAG: hypothetical protein ABI024_01675 [Vicinamibacterales bacterium]